MLQEHLSDNSSVGMEFVTTPCQCVTCQKSMQVVFQTKVIVIEGEVLSFKKPRMGEFACPNCGSHYIRWGAIQVTQ